MEELSLHVSYVSLEMLMNIKQNQSHGTRSIGNLLIYTNNYKILSNSLPDCAFVSQSYDWHAEVTTLFKLCSAMIHGAKTANPHNEPHTSHPRATTSRPRGHHEPPTSHPRAATSRTAKSQHGSDMSPLCSG